MPAITFERFDGGLDVSRSPSVAGANQLRVLKNAYVTTGRTLRKRPGLRKLGTLKAGTVGLAAGGHAVYGDARLWVFGDDSQGNAHPGVSGVTVTTQPLPPNDAYPIAWPTRIRSAVDFNGYLYVVAEWGQNLTRHCWIGGTTRKWTPQTVYAAGDTVIPTTPNGYRYRALVGGTSGGNEPSWPRGNWAPTVVDGGVTWEAHEWDVEDPNCPHTPSIAKGASKVWAADGDVVRFSATGNPGDWTTANDAGFLPTGMHTSGDADALAVGTFRNYLVVLGSDWMQLWVVDPDPAKHAIQQQLAGLGTRFPRSVVEVAGDLYFLSDLGVRSATLNTVTGMANHLDVGSPVDKLIRQDVAAWDAMNYYPPGWEPVAAFWPAAGQYWLAMDQNVWVYTFSPTAKVAGWSQFTLPFKVDAMVPFQGKLYIRSGDDLYVVDETAYDDGGVAIPVEIALPYMDAKSPGVLKQWLGIDAVLEGTGQVSCAFDPRDTSRETQAITMTGNTRPGEMQALEVCSTEISPIVRHQAAEAFELQALTLYFENLGPV